MVSFRSYLLLFCFSQALACGSGAIAHAARPNIDTVVVCADALLQAAAPWIEFRRRQGHEIALIPGSESKAEIKSVIRAIARQTELKFVVLIGDAPPDELKLGTQVDSHRETSQVIQRWGAEPTFCSDNWYSDLDGDGVPDVAIGRICADSPHELSTIVNKILAYEKSRSVGAWRRRVNFIAGVGGFGALTDKILESAAKKFITDGIPPEYRTSMTQASWRSPYSPDPFSFQSQTIERMNQGCLAWVYLGHGRKRELDVYRVPQGGLPILSTREIPQISCREGSPIAVFLSCYAGAFDASPDCLAEDLLASPGGPVSVIAGSCVTMPYAMTVMGNAMLHELFVEKRATIGEVLFYAKRELAKRPDQNSQSMVDKLAAVISPNPELLHDERMEHVRLFNLIGDPLLRIRQPKEVTIDIPDYGKAGETLTVQGTCPLHGSCLVELVCRRDRLTFKPEHRPKFEATHQWLSGLQETYERANNSVWSSMRQEIQDGKFSAELEIPPTALGPSHVRVFVENDRDFAMGSSDIYLRLPEVDRATLVDE